MHPLSSGTNISVAVNDTNIYLRQRVPQTACLAPCRLAKYSKRAFVLSFSECPSPTNFWRSPPQKLSPLETLTNRVFNHLPTFFCAASGFEAAAPGTVVGVDDKGRLRFARSPRQTKAEQDLLSLAEAGLCLSERPKGQGPKYLQR